MGNEKSFVLRGFDMHEGWYDITGPVSEAEATRQFNELTGNGTHHIKYEHGDYYKVFPGNTRMFYRTDSSFDEDEV